MATAPNSEAAPTGRPDLAQEFHFWADHAPVRVPAAGAGHVYAHLQVPLQYAQPAPVSAAGMRRVP